jgi:tetratricopeptide (TPR) repeat protein
VLNDLLLAAPIVFAMLIVVAFVRPTAAHPASSFLALASLGCLGINILFNREIGAARDWDTLAPYAFVYVCWGCVELLRRPSLRAALAVVLLVGVAILHGLPWTLLNALPGAAERQIRTLLEEKSQWSPYARGYLHEEFAIMARQAGDLQATLREYEAASQASPGDARYHVGRGDTWFRLGNIQQAIFAYEEAIQRRPTWMPAHNNLAAVLLASGGDLTRALQHAQEASRLSPGNPEAWVTLGDVAMARNDIDAALAAFDRAQRLVPNSQRVAQRLQDARRRQAELAP